MKLMAKVYSSFCKVLTKALLKKVFFYLSVRQIVLQPTDKVFKSKVFTLRLKKKLTASYCSPLKEFDGVVFELEV